MSRPAEIPTWATNDTFVSPSDSWDGDPTKVAPSAGRQAEGFEPTQQPPAEFFNWLYNRLGGWIAYLSEFLLWNWLDGADFAGAGTVAAFAHDSAMDTGRGFYASVSENATRERSSNGIDWAAAGGPGGSTALYAIAADQAGLMIAVGEDASGRTIESTTNASGYTDETPAAAGAGGDNFHGVVWDPLTSLWVVVGTGEELETSPDGAAWTTRTTPGTDDLFAVATDETSILVAVGSNGKIISSPDAINWTQRTSGTATTLTDVIWCSELGLFVALSNSVLLISADGISWTPGTHPGTHGGADSQIATDGRVIMALGSAATYRAFSVDGGNTWKQWDQSLAGLPQIRTALDFARGRFFAGGITGQWQYTLRFEE